MAGSGKEALERLKKNIPDGIILDLMMPEMDGFEVLEKLRGTEKTKNIPVLILTAKDLTRKDLAKLSANNIQQLIQKGEIDIKGLLYKVNQMFADKSDVFVHANPVLTKQENALAHVLIVEDNPDNLVTLNAILKGKYMISEATNAEKGFIKAQTLIPDIILLDMSLPGVSGRECIDLLKENNKTMKIPIIAVTAQAMKGDMEKFLIAGCNGYVSKPIDQELLSSEIERLLNRNNN